MKKQKILAVITAAAMLGGLSVSAPMASAEEITVKYDGQTVDFDVPAQIINDRTMVPMRKIFELFGSKVQWEQSTQTVTARKNSKTITMTIGSSDITKSDNDGTNAETTVSDAAPVVVDGRTLVPLRAISELLGLNVTWDDDSKTVDITETKDGSSEWKNNIGSVNLATGEVDGSGISLDGGVLSITEGGDFAISGTLDGCITVDTDDKVRLRFANVSINAVSGPAVYIKNADKAYITLEDGTENYLTDADEYLGDYADLKGCISAKDKLEINGSGALKVTSAAHRGINASDSLEISDGNVTVNAEKDGIRVNDTLTVSGGEVSVTSALDGIYSESIADITDGDISVVTTGEVTSSQSGFGRQAASVQTDSTSDISSKGIKADWQLDVSGGRITVSSTDHCMDSDGSINISGGELTLASSVKKGISAEKDVTIDGGTINITQSTEGIESGRILTVNDGEITITASDDGMNAGGGGEMMNGGGQRPQTNNGNQPQEMPENMSGADRPQKPQDGIMGSRENMNGVQPENRTAPDIMAGGKNGRMQNGENQPPEGMQERPQRPEMNGEMPQGGKGGRGGMFGSGNGEISSEHHIAVNGGSINITADGDGIDSNGSLVINGGTVIVNGPENSGNGPIDTNGAFLINGGTVIAAGSSGMTVAPGEASEQYSISKRLAASYEAGTAVSIKDSSGNALTEFTPTKKFGYILFSSAELDKNESYTLYINGEAQQ